MKSTRTTPPTYKSRIGVGQARLSFAKAGVDLVFIKILTFWLSWIFVFIVISRDHALAYYLP